VTAMPRSLTHPTEAVEDMLRVAVVVITYNSSQDLETCLESIRERGDDGVEITDVVVVDNASSDDSVEIAGAMPGLPMTVVRMAANLGYSAGFNAGVESLRSRPPDAVLLLNPDCRVRAGAIGTLARTAQDPARGIVAPRLVNPDGSLQPTLRRRPTVSGAMVEAIVGGRLADRLGVGELIFGTAAHDRAGRASWVTGAALLMSWNLIETVGPWDETFLLYSEETEFMLRAADQGWATWYEPAAVIEHRGGEYDTRPGLAALLTVNKVNLFRRRHGSARGFAYRTAMLTGLLIRASMGGRSARAGAAALMRPSRRITSLSQLR
jgi:N-acetylglucosaminyl-diphospho-decaprenol L-rhamnosyltransferase